MASLPMPQPTVPNRPLTTFKLLSFDIYGTLIDWETGILTSLKPLLSHLPSDSEYSDIDTNTTTRSKLAALFNQVEHAIQDAQPSLKYDSLLSETYTQLATHLSIPVTDSIRQDAQTFGESIGTWLPFPDTIDAMIRLSKHYKLVPLSNVDRDSFSRTCAGPLQGKIPFWRVYTAQDIGSYKPDLRNFEYLLENVDRDCKAEEKGSGEGIKKEEVLQVAQSLFHDHVPAKKMGMSSVWINRKGAGMGAADGIEGVHERGEVGYGWRFATLGEFADEVERQYAEKGQ